MAVTIHFAYGANMVRTAMARRCPTAAVLGPAVLADHRFAIVRGGYGTVLPARGARVWGVLWRLGRGDEDALDRFEEVADGLYRRERRVVCAAGRRVPALVYVATSVEPGHARAAYLAAIVAAAQSFGLPADYVAALEAIASTSAGVRPAPRSEATVSERSRLA